MTGPTLFLSYNSVDRASVFAVQKLLAARGITTFLDRDQLVPGLPWPEALEEGLRGVRAVAVFIGQVLGEWQKREIYFALDRQVQENNQGHPFPVIPVLLAGADLTPSFLFGNTWIDLRMGLDSETVAKGLEAFERAITVTPPASPSAAERSAGLCPYRGLEAFCEEHAAFFAGRTAFANELFKFTLGKELVAVVGPSGSGKSSVVQAGLVPLLRRQLPPATTWDVVTFTPGSDPFLRLASALTPLLEPDLSETDRLTEAQKLGERLADGDVRLESVIDRVIDKSNGTGRLLVLADQFEELFTLTPDPKRRPFAGSVIRALGRARFTLLVTLRADFYSQIITLDRDLSDRLAPAQVNIGALTRDELRESIAKPAKLVGLEFEPGLVDRILHDVGSEPGNLPLLEFALTGLWTKRQGRNVTNAVYDEIGGVTGALAQRAEAEFARFTTEQQAATRRLFSRLVRVVRPDEGAEDTRQRLDLQATDVVTERVAQTLAGPEVRLLVMGHPETGGEAGRQTVELAHEALIRNWKRLRGWLNEDREFLLWRQRTQIQVEQWNEHQRNADCLLRGAPLAEAERWLIGRPQDLMIVEQEFVRNSVELQERESDEEERRRQGEIENAKRLKEAAEARAAAEVRRARVLRFSSLALGVLLLLALGAVVLAFWQRAVARARELASASVVSHNADPEISMLIAAHAVAATWKWGHIVLPEAEQQLHAAMLALRDRLTLSGHNEAVSSVAWSPDGKRLATASEDKTAKVWDAATGKELLTLIGHNDSVLNVAWSPDGERLATASFDKTAKVWDAATGKELLTLIGHNDALWSFAWSPDGKRLATASYDGTAKVWNTTTGKELLSLRGHSDRVMSVAWSPDGKRLATGSQDGTAKVWDTTTGKGLFTLSGHEGVVVSVDWSPDGKWLATGSFDKTAKVWDAGKGKEPMTLAGHNDAVLNVSWSPTGRYLATGSRDNTAKVWDVGTGKEQMTLAGHNDGVMSVAWSPDEKWLATGSLDGTAKVWGGGNGKELLIVGEPATSVAWSPDSGRLATGRPDKTAKVWDAATGKELLTLSGHNNVVSSVAWSPDGERLATASFDKTAKVWDAAAGKELLSLRGHGDRVMSVGWSPDGKRLATGSADKTAKVWDAATGKELLSLRGHGDRVMSVGWSPDGKRLATGSADKTAKVWDGGTGAELLTLQAHDGGVTSVAWSPHGKRLATGSQDKTAKVWDPGTGKELFTLRGHDGSVLTVAWSPNGKRLTTGSADSTAKVWDTTTGKELLSLRGHTDSVLNVAWSPDGRRLSSASFDNSVQVYAMDIRELMALGRKRVNIPHSDQRCKKYLDVDKCPPFPVLSWW